MATSMISVATQQQSDIMHCSKCSAPGRGNFCSECGGKMLAVKICCQCKMELKPSSKFCPECGRKVEESQESTSLQKCLSKEGRESMDALIKKYKTEPSKKCITGSKSPKSTKNGEEVTVGVQLMDAKKRVIRPVYFEGPHKSSIIYVRMHKKGNIEHILNTLIEMLPVLGNMELQPMIHIDQAWRSSVTIEDMWREKRRLKTANLRLSVEIIGKDYNDVKELIKNSQIKDGVQKEDSNSNKKGKRPFKGINKVKGQSSHCKQQKLEEVTKCKQQKLEEVTKACAEDQKRKLEDSDEDLLPIKPERRKACAEDQKRKLEDSDEDSLPITPERRKACAEDQKRKLEDSDDDSLPITPERRKTCFEDQKRKLEDSDEDFLPIITPERRKACAEDQKRKREDSDEDSLPITPEKRKSREPDSKESPVPSTSTSNASQEPGKDNAIIEIDLGAAKAFKEVEDIRDLSEEDHELEKFVRLQKRLEDRKQECTRRIRLTSLVKEKDFTVFYEARNNIGLSFKAPLNADIGYIYDMVCYLLEADNAAPKFHLKSNDTIYDRSYKGILSDMPPVLVLVEEDFDPDDTITNYDEVLF